MGDPKPLSLRFDAFELDEINARLTRDGRPVPLPPKALAVLCALARHPGQLVTKNALLDAVWGHRHVSESVLKTTISQLRAALSDDARQPRFIETASRFGYRFISPGIEVQRTSGTAAAQAIAPASAVRPPAIASEAPKSAALIGRQAALMRLRESWQQTLAGECQLVWIAGEAGIGKSTLIQSFLTEVPLSAIAHGQCVEHFGTSEPYLPLLEAIRDLCRRDPQLPMIVRSVAPTWLLQMPWLTTESERAALHRELAGAHPNRMVREMREILHQYTERQPLVLVLEDLHWSDHATLNMMEHLARGPRAVRILLIGSYRLTQIIAENHPLRSLRQELRLHGLCEEILLDPFSESEVGAYLERRFPDRPFEEALVRQIHAHTEGLPLFVANVIDTLVSQPAGPAPVPSHLPVPETLSDAIEKQINRLPPDMQRALEAASVCGTEFQASILADVLQQEVGWVHERCDDLVRGQYWLRHVDIGERVDGTLDARYSFQHALYTHVFYQRMPLPQRVRYHRLVARTLEARCASGTPVGAAELASHHERGQQFAAAIRQYGRAAEAALDQFASREAADLAAHGLSLLSKCPEGPERIELELAVVAPQGVALARLYGVVSPSASEAFERVQTLCDLLPPTPARALLLHGLGLTFYARGEYNRAYALGERLHTLANDRDNNVLRILACTMLGGTMAAQGAHAGACEWLQQGIAIVEKLGEKLPSAALVVDSEVILRTCIAGPLLQLGRIDQARSQMAQAQARAERIRQPTSQTLVHWYGGLMAARLRLPDEVAQHALALSQIMASAGTALGAGPTLYLQGYSESLLGNARLGLQHIQEGHARQLEMGMHAGDTEVLCFAAEALIRAEDWPEAQGQIDRALEIAKQRGEGLCIPALLMQQARAALGRGDPAGARESLGRSIREAQARGALMAELQARVALAQSGGSSERAELAAVYSRFTEGLD
ncbi:MAG TPA: AAA family ATPase, partial [Steroidobacteraceae bacterium]|nr:AAA family ATPase [Steroidobacteraceae bacterium]